MSEHEISVNVYRSLNNQKPFAVSFTCLKSSAPDNILKSGTIFVLHIISVSQCVVFHPQLFSLDKEGGSIKPKNFIIF